MDNKNNIPGQQDVTNNVINTDKKDIADNGAEPAEGDNKDNDKTLEGISMSDGSKVYSDPKSKYIDDVHNTVEDKKEISKAQKKVWSKKDRREITLLSVIDAAVFIFTGLFIFMSGSSDEYDSIKENARFEGDSSIYLSSESFAQGLTPNYKETEYPEYIADKFKPLYSENNDTAGWIRIPGTNIDYVIMQGDTNETYSRHDFYHDYQIEGSIFMDYRNKPGLTRKSLSKNTIVYGHYMAKQKTMFTALENYKHLDFYKEHPIIEMDTLFRDYKWKVFGAFIANVDEKYDNGKVFYYWYDKFSDNNTIPFANEVASRSYFINPAVDILPTDKFLTLSTCTHLLDIEGVVNARMVVMARLVRDGETEDVDVEAAYENPKQRMPQLWYDQNDAGPNPYENAPVWDPFA